MSEPHIVIDTNTFISRLLAPSSVPAQAVKLAFEIGIVITSSQTLGELTEVLNRGKFDRYVTKENRQLFLQKLGLITQLVEVRESIFDCRDVKDNKFLELAVSGNALVIITGDRDLLTLTPFRGIAIITPRQFIDTYFPLTLKE